ncbi:MAG: tRNA 2-thiouridine(34) synthase MnmA [Monoglobales bacterium]
MRVLVAMSGGVDSSVTAKLLQDGGYECIGCIMRLYDNEDVGISKSNTCCSLDDVEDARSVAYRLNMPFYVFNFTSDFKEKIINKFVSSYKSGITPNPCIDCNRYMKFDRLYNRAKVLDCDYIATGHYARIEKEDGKYVLKKALDETKDQSYVLYAMTQEQLAHTLFPLGGLQKSETRTIAEQSGFINAKKPDSQDICFVPNGKYADIVELHSGKKSEPGEFKNINGEVLGQHRGIIHYTIGQRKGLGLALPSPHYVCGINSDTNTVILGSEKDLYSDTFTVENFNWISGETPSEPIYCKVKIRYRQKEQPAKVFPLQGGRVEVVFDQPQRAITPGQAAVLYDGDVVLGGGTVAKNRDL